MLNKTTAVQIFFMNNNLKQKNKSLDFMVKKIKILCFKLQWKLRIQTAISVYFKIMQKEKTITIINLISIKINKTTPLLA